MMSKGNINENNQEVLVAELDVEVNKHVLEINNLYKYGIDEVSQLLEISHEIKFDYPELASRIEDKVASLQTHFTGIKKDLIEINRIVKQDKQSI